MKPKTKTLAAAFAIVLLFCGTAQLIHDAEATDVSEITLAPGFKYVYTPTFPSDLDPQVSIKTQGIGTSGTGGNWGTVSDKTLTVLVPLNATAGSTYQVTLHAVDHTTDPPQTLDIKILFHITDNITVSGHQPDIVTGDSVDMIPSITGIGEPFKWSVTEGKILPDGLTLDTDTGRVTGTPTGMGKQAIYITVESVYKEFVDLVVEFNVVSKLIATNSPTNGAIIYA